MSNRYLSGLELMIPNFSDIIIMNCAKLHLQERSRSRPKSEPRHDKPRRYCQKRLVDPQFEENRWTYEAQR